MKCRRGEWLGAGEQQAPCTVPFSATWHAWIGCSRSGAGIDGANGHVSCFLPSSHFETGQLPKRVPDRGLSPVSGIMPVALRVLSWEVRPCPFEFLHDPWPRRRLSVPARCSPDGPLRETDKPTLHLACHLNARRAYTNALPGRPGSARETYGADGHGHAIVTETYSMTPLPSAVGQRRRRRRRVQE